MPKIIKDSNILLPADFKESLVIDKKVFGLWNNLTQIAQRDFVTWIESAKRADTRARRIEIAKSKLISGDRRPCCYAVVPMKLYQALGEDLQAKATWKTLTGMQRRDIVSWIDEAKDSEQKAIRIQKACVILSKGKHP